MLRTLEEYGIKLARDPSLIRELIIDFLEWLPVDWNVYLFVLFKIVSSRKEKKNENELKSVERVRRN